MEPVSFICILDPGVAALKCSGVGEGGKVTLAFDGSQLAEAVKLLLMTNRTIRATFEAEE